MITLDASARDVKVNPKMIRTEGKIPAVFYGRGQESTSISVDKIAFKKAWLAAGESSIISLKTPKGAVDALIHDVELDPVLGEPIHVDFYVVAKDRKIEVDVPVEFIGAAPAEKLGGVVVKVMHVIRIEALPSKLPQNFIVDLSLLTQMDSHITVGDLKFDEGVVPLLDLSEVVAGITVQQEEKEEVEVVDLASIEVEKKGKKEEDTDAEAAPDKK